MNVPTHLNGYKVIESIHHANCATVMMHTEEKVIIATWWPELGSQWSWGHYFHGPTKIADAAKAFIEIAGKNTKR